MNNPAIFIKISYSLEKTMDESSKKYLKSLKSLITRINKKISLLEENQYSTKLAKKDTSKNLMGSKDIIENLKLAQELLKNNEYQKAFDLICEIPHYIVEPHENIEIERFIVNNKVYIGSSKMYIMLDTARHYCRMISLDNELSLNTKQINNNLLFL